MNSARRSSRPLLCDDAPQTTSSITIERRCPACLTESGHAFRIFALRVSARLLLCSSGVTLKVSGGHADNSVEALHEGGLKMDVCEPRVRRRGFFLHSDTTGEDHTEHESA